MDTPSMHNEHRVGHPRYIFSVKEEFHGGLNGVEVVIFQRTDVVGGVTARCVRLCAAQKGCVQQWTKVL